MINRQWHEKNRMPKNPTLEQRIAWHVEHQKHCDCRKMPEKIRSALVKRDESSSDPSKQ